MMVVLIFGFDLLGCFGFSDVCALCFDVCFVGCGLLGLWV